MVCHQRVARLARVLGAKGQSYKKGSIITGEMKRIESLTSRRLLVLVPRSSGHPVVPVVTGSTCRDLLFQVFPFIRRDASGSRFPQTLAVYYFVDSAIPPVLSHRFRLVHLGPNYPPTIHQSAHGTTLPDHRVYALPTRPSLPSSGLR